MSVATPSTTWWMSFILLLGVVCLAHAEEEYTVTILTDPPNEPYTIYSRVQITCLLEPPPPEPAAISYQWRYIVNQYGGQHSQQNLSFILYGGYLRFWWLFCSVYSNNKLLSFGKRVVEVQGIYFSSLKPVQHYSNGDMLTLRATAIDQFHSLFIREITWYHNRSEISSDGRFMIGREIHDRVLNITDLGSSDAGTYRMKTTATMLTDDPVCDSLLLSLLENVAIFAPVTFTLRESTDCKIEEYSSSISLQPQITTYYQNGGELVVTESIYLPVQLNASVFLDISINQWYHNGETISSDGTKYNSTISASGHDITLILVIKNINEADSGYYTFHFYADTFDYFNYNSDLSYCYFDLSIFRNDFYIDYLVTEVITISIENYKSPALQFSLSTSEAENSLQCRVVGGNPSTYNHHIMLTKNSLIITQTYGDHLFYSASNEFGVYTCVVESLHSNDSKTLFVPERVTFNIMITVEEQCQKQSVLEEGKHINSILMSIIAVMEEQCGCTLSLDNFEGTQMSCLGYGSYSLFTSTLIYTDSEGNVLASDLVRFLQSQIKATDGQLVPGQLNVAFPSDCPLPTLSDCPLPTPSGYPFPTDIVGVLVGMWTLGILTLLMAIGIGICIFNKRVNTAAEGKRGSTDTKHDYTTSNDVKCNTLQVQTNTTYETVSNPRRERPDQQETAALYEVVYDIPV